MKGLVLNYKSRVEEMQQELLKNDKEKSKKLLTNAAEFCIIAKHV